MTPVKRTLAAFAVILTGLAGRAGVDKILALRGGPDMVALWAQLQSVTELVAGVALAGIGSGLTVMVAQARPPQDDLRLLRCAIRPAMLASLAAALLVMAAAPAASAWLSGGGISAGLVTLAAAVGCAAVLPGLLSGYWLGRQRQELVLLLTLAGIGPLFVVTLLSSVDAFPANGLIAQGGVALVLAALMHRWLRDRRRAAADAHATEHARRQLLHYLPVGVAIGLFSPASVIVVRGLLSDSLSWGDAGFVQALWRCSEWVTGGAAGVLSLLFLPRLSAAWGTRNFPRELARSGMTVLAPAAIALSLIYFNQRIILATFYDAQFVVSDSAAALFMCGDWLRIASWVFLFALYAMRRTGPIIVGEIVSLPLYALLLHLYSASMSLELAGLLYLLTYLSYLVFNAAAVLHTARRGIVR